MSVQRPRGARKRGLQFLGAILASGVAVFATGALAASETITFQELATGTVVTDQYVDRGVRFGSAPGGGVFSLPPKVVELGAAGNKAASFSNFVSGRTFVNRVVATFADPTSTIRLSVATASIDRAMNYGVVLIGLDAGGTEIKRTDPFVAVVGGGFRALPELTAPAGQQFSGFRLEDSEGSTTDKKLAFDDLSFERPDAPPPAEPTTTTTTTTTPTELPPAVPDDAGVTIAGPETLRLGEPARFVAEVQPDAVRHEWDADSNGTYERDTGSDPVLSVSFPASGQKRIALRATLPDGRTVEASLDVSVRRPPLMGVGFEPANPKPGEKVSLDVDGATEAGTSFSLFAWEFEGLKPVDDSVVLRASRARAVGTNTAAQSVSLEGAQPTFRPGLKRSFPKKGSLPYVVKAFDDAGRGSTVYGNIGVADGGAPGPLSPKSTNIIDCDKPGYKGPCAAIAVAGVPATQVRTVFSNASPEVEVCVPGGITANTVENNALATYNAKVDLGYPADQVGAGFDSQMTGPVAGQVVGGRATTRGASDPPRAQSAQTTGQKCRMARPRALSWDLGDGTKLGPDNDVVTHEYGEARTYTVTLEIELPFFKSAVEFANGEEDAQYFKARKTIQVKVVKAFCGTLKLNSIPTRAVFQKKSGDTDVGASGCFLPQDAIYADGKGTVYKPFPGYAVDLNTMTVTASKGVPTIDPKKARISPPPGESLTGTLAGRNVFAGPQIDVPLPIKNKSIPELNKDFVAALPAQSAPAEQINGLNVTRTQTFLSPSVGARTIAWLDMPYPMTGDPRAVIGGSAKPTLSRSTAADDADTDFEIDLSGTDLGFVYAEELIIKHRRKGGWLGGGRLKFPAPLDMTLDATYLRPPGADTETSKYCSRPDLNDRDKDGETDDEITDGPSGLSIDENGGFEFGGAALMFDPPKKLFYFLELSCVSVAANAQADGPFYVVGKLALGIPAGTPAIQVDGCVLYARLKANQPLGATLCEADKAFTLNQDFTWVRGLVSINLYNQLELGSAYVDIRSDNCQAGDDKCEPYKRYGFGGEVRLGDVKYDKDGEPEGDLGLIAKIDGVIYEGKPMRWQVAGKGDGCVPIFCVSVTANASHIGVGACAGRKGYIKYYFATKELDYGLFSCQISDLLFEKPEVRAVDLGAAPRQTLGGAMVQDVKVPKDLDRVGIAIRGTASATPQVTLTSPDGTKIVDDGAGWRETPGYHIGRKDNTVYVQIEKPKAGTWRVEGQPGSAPFQPVEVALPIKEPRVLGAVTGKGDRKTLRYMVDVAKGDEVTFTEDGETVARPLGQGRNGKGKLRFAVGAGSLGRRTISAVVSRDGIPIKRFVLDRYVAKKPPLGKPRKLRVHRARGGLAVSWKAARGARSYRLVASLPGGRRATIKTEKTSAFIAGTTLTERARVSLVAVGEFTRESAPVKRALKQKRPKPVKLAL